MVGRIGGGQKISIGRGCEYLHTVIHEIGEFLAPIKRQSFYGFGYRGLEGSIKRINRSKVLLNSFICMVTKYITMKLRFRITLHDS